MRIVIIGAGVGGLAAARALLAAGHEVVVCEQADELRTGGATLTIWSNGSGILRELGVRTEGLGNRIDALQAIDDRGRPLSLLRLDRVARWHGSPTLVVPRRQLLHALADGLPPGCIRFALPCKRISERGRTVIAEFGTGEELAADLVVGADGHRSVVRRHLVGGSDAELTGGASWQGLGVLPIPFTAGHQSLAIFGRAGFGTLLPAGDGRLHWLFDLPWREGLVPPGGRLANLKDHFGQWPDPVPAVLDSLTEESISLFPHVRHRVPAVWARHRVVMLGDAAHVFPPTRAQGANQTLEDAWVLGTVLRGLTDPTPGLRQYVRTRRTRARLMSTLSTKVPPYRVPPEPVITRVPPGLITGMFGLEQRLFSNFLARRRR